MCESQDSNFLGFVTHWVRESLKCNFWFFLTKHLCFDNLKDHFYVQSHIHLNTKGLNNA